MRSALMLLYVCLENNSDKKADELIFPILFNANQSIELYLKAIIWKANEVILSRENIHNEIDTKMDNSYFPNSHDLNELHGYARKKIGTISDEYKNDFDKYAVTLKKYCKELSSLDFPEGKGSAVSEFTRYPISHNKKDFFYTEKGKSVAIDLENLYTKLKKINDILDTLYTCCDNILKALPIKYKHVS